MSLEMYLLCQWTVTLAGAETEHLRTIFSILLSLTRSRFGALEQYLKFADPQGLELAPRTAF